MEKLIEKYYIEGQKMATLNGLLMAQLVCTRKYMEATSVEKLELLNSIMEDIANLTEEISKK